MATTFLYNPDRKIKGELIAEFVIRTEIYGEIMHDLETSNMQHPEQHYLLVGQRGAGKTTLLNRLKYGIEDSEILHSSVIPVLFSEEQYNISELVNLWESIAQYLEDYHGFDGLYDEIEANFDQKDFEELSYNILEKYLKKYNRKLVLLIDNIGDLLKKMDQIEIRRLREILQTKNEIRLIVGSPFFLETVFNYQQPLFEFFKVIRLDGLSKGETQDLLHKLAIINGEEAKISRIIEETPERIETLRKLTGGVPRTIALMFNIFIEYNNEDTIKDLEKILDAVTPLYKHRMDDLPTQQQKIVDAVAKNWDGISAKELKEKLRIESKIISAQLRQLEKNQIIDIVPTGTKNNLYFLRERFFNIWYLMRYGRKHDKQRVIWLVKFLENWCSKIEIEERIVDFVKKINEGKMNPNLVQFYGEVYSGIENIRSELKFLLKETTPHHLSTKIQIEDIELVRMATDEHDKKHFKKAIQLLRGIHDPDDKTARQVLYLILAISLNDDEIYRELSSEIENKSSEVKQETIDLSLFQYFFILCSLVQTQIYYLARKQYEGAAAALDLILSLAGHNNNKRNRFSERMDLPLAYIIGFSMETFLMFGQSNLIKSVFQTFPVLKEKLKPIYYVTLKIAGDNNEFLKMGAEIKDEVSDIFERIKEGQENVVHLVKSMEG